RTPLTRSAPANKRARRRGSRCAITCDDDLSILLRRALRGGGGAARRGGRRRGRRARRRLTLRIRLLLRLRPGLCTRCVFLLGAGGLRRRVEIGVPAAALENEVSAAYLPLRFFLFALRADGDRGVGDLLDLFPLVSARGAGVFVRRHRFSRGRTPTRWGS